MLHEFFEGPLLQYVAARRHLVFSQALDLD